MKNQIFTKPKLCKSSKGWYVYFYYNGKQKRYKKGINYIKNLYNREIEANALAEALLIKLKNNWNPDVPDVVNTPAQLTFLNALDFALSKKKETLAPKSYSGYKGTVKFIKTGCVALGLDLLTIDALKRTQIRLMMDKAKTQRNWTNKAYNKHMNQLKALLTELVQWDILEYNPVHNIKSLKVSETRANIPANFEQHKTIKSHLKIEHPNFYNFIRTIFHTGIRPKELLQLKLSDIDLTNNVFILKAEITKTDKYRLVPINHHMLNIIIDMEINNYPKDFYLFGAYDYNHKHRSVKKLDFIPGPNSIKRDTATKKWKRIVKDGLKIDVNMYSYKHKGGDEKIKSGVSLDALRDLYGHTTERMTERYAKQIKNVYKDDIINNSPDF